MPAQGLPQTRDYYRPWGFDFQAYSAARNAHDRQQDLDYFEKYGFFPEMRGGVMRAADRADESFGSAMDALGGARDDVLGGLSPEIEDFYRKTMSGENAPFSAGVLSSISSRITDPFYKSARANIGQARSSFAARGLGRSGGLIDLENRMMTEAIGKAISEEGNVRSQGALANFQARESAAGGMSGLHLGRANILAGLAGQQAQLHANRQFDPVVEAMRSRGKPYKPPPEATRRTTGRSVPTYQMTGSGGALGGY